MATAKGGRPSKLQLAERRRREVITRLDEIALDGAEQAMQTLVKVASGEKVPREVISACTYLLNQVVGRPSEKEPPSDATDQVRDLILDVRTIRQRAVRAHPAGDGAVVEPADGLPPLDGPVADP